MSFLFSIVLAAISLTYPLQHVSAHIGGQAPYLKINGEYSILYNVVLNAPPAKGLDIPEDNAPENYLVNTPIVFELEKQFFPLSKVDIEKAQFSWNFGDGTKTEGLTATHSYSKIGSYILTIQIHNAPSFIAPFPGFAFESVLINILPDKNYRLPKAIITVNDKSVNDPIMEYIWFDFHEKFFFDASKSQAGSANLSAYFWDFGDGNTSTQSAITHTFDQSNAQLYPILHVVDANGFVSDNFVELDNSTYTPNAGLVQTTNTPSSVSTKQHTNNTSVLNLSNRTNDFIKRLTIEMFHASGVTYYTLLITILVFAFLAGALHALTPGHGKSLMAALLVGKSGSKIADVIILALSITIAHTLIIYILGVVFLLLNSHYSFNSLIPYFDKVSASFVLALALTLLYRAYANWRHARDHDIRHEHAHTRAAKPKIHSRLELFLAGAGGGLTPCIDALALLILAITIKQIAFGLFIVFIFSLGLASCIIALGLLVVLGKNTFRLEEKLGTVADIYAPLFSGIIIFLIACKLLTG